MQECPPCYPHRHDQARARSAPAILDALAFLETLRRGPDGEHGNGGHDRERVEKTAQRVTERLQAAAVILGEEITG